MTEETVPYFGWLFFHLPPLLIDQAPSVFQFIKENTGSLLQEVVFWSIQDDTGRCGSLLGKLRLE